eukprot:scaffold309379_cov19-Tisochrysis_lutea.AAC.1
MACALAAGLPLEKGCKSLRQNPPEAMGILKSSKKHMVQCFPACRWCTETLHEEILNAVSKLQDKVPDSMVTIIASLYSINTTGGPKCTPDSFAALTSQRKPHCGHALLRLKAWGATSNRRTPSAHTVQKSDEQDNGNSVHTHAGVQAMTW